MSRTAKKTSAQPQVSVYGTPAGVVVTGLTATQVRRAIALLNRKRGPALSEDVKAAVRLDQVLEAYYANGKKFKVRKSATAKPKAKPAAKRAAKKRAKSS